MVDTWNGNLNGDTIGQVVRANKGPHSLTFDALNRPLLTFRPDGRIELSDDADPTEAAAQCITAMQDCFAEMIAQVRAEAASGNWQETLNDIARLEADNAALRAGEG